MGNYSGTERVIAVFLSRFPSLKLKLKKLYQRGNYYMFRKSYTHLCEHKLVAYKDGDRETFFGYYDKSPINATQEYIIFHSTSHPTNQLPDANQPIEVVLQRLSDGEICGRFSTSAYNWQQGAKSMWIDDYRFIFNDFNPAKKTYCAKIVDAQKGEIVQEIDQAIYDTAGKWALSLNFDRLAVLRPDYGYRNRNGAVDIHQIEGDGITLIDLEKNSSSLLLSMNQIIKCSYLPEMEKAQHKVNHIMISPNGKRFIFLHRYFIDGVKHDRLLLSDFEGNLQLLSADGMISHCYWYNDNRIISFMRRYGIGDKYFDIDLASGDIKTIGQGVIDGFGDGHPHICGDQMLFDIYPDRSRMKSLYCYNLLTGELQKLGEFFESFKYYGETRCDLHQRFTPDNKGVLFDSVHEGKRQLYKLTIHE